MRRLLSIGAILVALGAALAGGYYVHKAKIDPIYSIAERVEAKFLRELDLPSATVTAVDSLQTTFLKLRGTVYTMPGQDFYGGGALTRWDDDVLTLHAKGNVFYLDEAEGMIQTQIQVPDNGEDAFFELAREKYPEQAKSTKGIRYHDLDYIDTGTQRGLLLSYPHINVAQECYHSRVSWLPLPDDIQSVRDITADNQNWETLWDSQPCIPFNANRELILGYMAGGRMAFKEPNLLYFGNGEYHLDGIYRPDVGIQDDDVDYGKVMEINLDTRVARVYSKGHRNLQGVAVDRDGAIWTTEHGMRGGDELNQIIEGENYGWPLEDMGTLYTGVPAPSVAGSGPGRHNLYRAPVFAFVPSAAISSVEALDGFHEYWDGDLLITSLRERTLFRARPENGRLLSLEAIPISQRIRDVLQWDQRLVLWLDTTELVVFEIEERTDPLEGLEEALSADIGLARAKNVALELEGCAECHSYEDNIQQAGPSLYRIHNKAIASTGFSYYSDELLAAPGVWDTKTLTAFLADPESIAPNTMMASFAINDDVLRADVVKGLEWLEKKQAAEPASIQ